MSSPGWWRKCIGTLERHTSIYSRQPSWLIHQRPYLIYRSQQSSQTQASNFQILKQILPTSKRGTLMRPSVRNWGRKMCMKPTCTRYITLLWVRPMSNCSIRRHWTSPPRWSIQANILSDNSLSSRRSASPTNLKNTPSGLCAWQPVDCTTPSSTQIRTHPIPYSGSGIHRRSTMCAIGASYK